MDIITRYLLWRDKRALIRIRLALSLLVDPQWVNSMDDAKLTDQLINADRQTRNRGESVRSLTQHARDFELTWRLFAENADPEVIKEKIRAYTESLRTIAQTTQENAQ